MAFYRTTPCYGLLGKIIAKLSTILAMSCPTSPVSKSCQNTKHIYNYLIVNSLNFKHILSSTLAFCEPLKAAVFSVERPVFIF